MTDEFNDWWDSGALLPDNPYVKDSPAFWAWAGWQACIAAEMPGKVITVPYLMELAGYLRKEKMEEAVKAEREACARVCEVHGSMAKHAVWMAEECAALIRARGSDAPAPRKSTCVYPQCVSTTRTTCDAWASGACEGPP